MAASLLAVLLAAGLVGGATPASAGPPLLNLSFNPPSILPGGTATLNLAVVTDEVGTAVSGVAFTVTLPSGLVVANPPSDVVPVGCPAHGTFTNGANGVITAGDTSLKIAGHAQPAGFGCTFSVQVTAASAGTYPVSTSAETSDQGAPGTATASLDVSVPAPDLLIQKIHAGNFTQGGTGSYVITVFNLGPGDEPAGQTVTVVDSAPVGMTVTAMVGPGWTCAVLPTCTRTDALPASSSYPTITVTVSIAGNAGSPLSNAATVSTTAAETSLGNNGATDPTTILLTPVNGTAALKTAVLASGPNGPKLASYLTSAIAYLNIGTPTMKAAACQQLKLFKSAVTVAARNDATVASNAVSWIAQADAIRASIPCLPPN